MDNDNENKVGPTPDESAQGPGEGSSGAPAGDSSAGRPREGESLPDNGEQAYDTHMTWLERDDEPRSDGTPIDDNNRGHLMPRDLEDELKQSFIAYAMAVIVTRALPDVRDGLKPVHRRIL